MPLTIVSLDNACWLWYLVVTLLGAAIIWRCDMEMREYLIGSLQMAISNATGRQKRILQEHMAEYMENIAAEEARKQAEQMTREQCRTKYLMSQRALAQKRQQWIAADRRAAGKDEFMVALLQRLDEMGKTLDELEGK